VPHLPQFRALALPGRLLLAFVATVVIQASGKPAQDWNAGAGQDLAMDFNETSVVLWPFLGFSPNVARSRSRRVHSSCPT
jgi:hypothetical protein